MNTKQLLSISIVLFYSCSYAQTFTRVVNPLNPVTTDQFESGGGTWVDINNDGLLDLFVSNGNLSTQNNSLYLNTGNGNFIKVTTGNIINDGGSSIGSTWADYDNDGFMDCFVTNRNNFGNFLYHGNGDTVFTKITTGDIVTDIGNSNSSSWVDINNDGILDLYVVNFMGADFFYTGEGAPNYIFASQTPVSAGAQFSIPGAWADYNNDLLPDLFIGNSGSQNDFLFTNNDSVNFIQSTFTDAKATLGASWADYDNDGDLDLFVANYLNDTSILYQNAGVLSSYTLTPVAGSAVSVIGNGVGSAWGDVDNDGDLDLFVCDDGGNNHLLLNSGFPNYTFTAVVTGAVANDGGNSFGCAFGDYDNDGQLDLFVANRLNQQNFLYHNDGNANHWITIKCTGTISNSSGIGTKVFVKATINGNATSQMQEVESQSGYNSENLWLHFGIGNATVIDTIIVKWQSGAVDSCFNIAPDNFYVATEGACLTTGLQEPLNNSATSLFQNYPNPFHTTTAISYRLNKTQHISLQVFDITGRITATLKNEIETEGIHHLDFDAHQLSKGCYFYKLSTEETVITKKFVVQ